MFGAAMSDASHAHIFIHSEHTICMCMHDANCFRATNISRRVRCTHHTTHAFHVFRCEIWSIVANVQSDCNRYALRFIFFISRSYLVYHRRHQIQLDSLATSQVLNKYWQNSAIPSGHRVSAISSVTTIGWDFTFALPFLYIQIFFTLIDRFK